MPQSQIGYVDPVDYDKVVRKLREFFHKKEFVEVHTQSRLSILAACEDPTTIATFNYAGQVYPLPQTGQMQLEYELLKNPSAKGFFNVGTSFRNEPNPVPGRHNLIFPMFEFEMHGDMEELIKLECELCNHLGFPMKDEAPGYPRGTYTDVAESYATKELEHAHEAKLEEDFGSVFFLTDFPEMTSPFWNMKRDSNNPGISKKVDVIIGGMEVIGSAERSCDKEDMLNRFKTISDGQYANTLYSQFTRERVDSEMAKFLEHGFFKRSGAGIGLTRLIKVMKKYNLL